MTLQKLARRAQAKGHTHFSPGFPCKHGHASKRYAHNASCVACVREKQLTPTYKKCARVWARKNWAANRAILNTRQQARRQKNLEKVREHARLSARKRAGLPLPTRPVPKRCECCGKKVCASLVLDHCHMTGAFRGWICPRCNLGLGLLGDKVFTVALALEYLGKKNA